MEMLLTGENAIALATLTLLEIVLGMDNIVFIAILTQKLPAHRQAQAAPNRAHRCDGNANWIAPDDRLGDGADCDAFHDLRSPR